ncbi:MAG: Ig-like domain-containing protein [Clostridium sp.]|nr:Ig-like domain-containing protein [Clostridium sp.]
MRYPRHCKKRDFSISPSCILIILMFFVIVLAGSLTARLAVAAQVPFGISGGASHSLALRGDGTVWAWGWNEQGQLGDRTTISRFAPARVFGLSSIASVSAGGIHSLALRIDGTVWAWGDNSVGQLGDGSTTRRLEPVQVSGPANIIAVAAGHHHSLALRNDGTVWAWGNNFSGQLGDGSTTRRLEPVQVSGLTNIIAVAAGYHHSLALRNDGVVLAWGNNSSGQLGDGSTAQRNTPVEVSGLGNAKFITAGKSHSLALRSDDTVSAWGNNSSGQLGDGTTARRLEPIQVSSLTNITTISAGWHHSLALRNDGTVWTWGWNGNGQLGDGTRSNRHTPVQVSVLTNVIALRAGGNHSLSLRNNNDAWSWGFNPAGQLGDGTNIQRQTPVQTKPLFVPATSIVVTPNTLAMNIDDSHNLISVVNPSDALQAVTWRSSNPAVATVNEIGIVTGIAAGTTNITATTTDATNRTATITVTVIARLPAANITISPITATVYLGNTRQLTSIVTPSNSLQAVAWSSNNPAVAAVNATGLVTSVTPGTALITAATIDGTNLTATSTITVDVRPYAENITVTPAALNVSIGATYQLVYAITPLDALQAVAWSSNNPAVATVNATGLVTGVAPGTATITAATVDGTNLTALSLITVPTPPTPPTPPITVEQPIVAGQINEIEIENVVRVTVNAGAVIGDSPRMIAQLMTDTAAAPLIAAASGTGLTLTSEVVLLTMTGGEFTSPVQLTLSFDETRIGAGQKPCVFVYNERTGRWIFLGGQIGDGFVSISLSRFSKFAVFATKPLPEMADIADHWGRGSIRTLAGMGIISGFPNGSFKPNAAVTRAEFVSMLTRALALAAKPKSAVRFTDADRWALGAIGAAAEAGLIAGYADGTFGGSRQITRAEMAAILQRVINKGLVPVLPTAGTDFIDANIFPTWAASGIRLASTTGLLRGFQDRSFRPGGITTRAEAAAILYRLVAER